MLTDFEEFTVRTRTADIFGRLAGSGPPVLLLHGIPQTHLIWRHVAPLLSQEFTVIVTDLRGYGSSSVGTSPADDHAADSMRALAGEQAEVMKALGHNKFAVVGHDRGARCAYRMALDFPDSVQALGVLDIVPTGEAFARADHQFALGYWEWSFLAAPAPVPERLIAGNPDAFVDHMLDDWAQKPDCFPDEVRKLYREQFHDPARVHAICEQYRAAATIDVEDDKERRKITCPTLALWSGQGAVANWYDPLSIWQQWADNVTGQPIDCGHFLPEEAPDETAHLLLEFLRSTQ